jgi:hypothetical protein
MADILADMDGCLTYRHLLPSLLPEHSDSVQVGAVAHLEKARLRKAQEFTALLRRVVCDPVLVNSSWEDVSWGLVGTISCHDKDNTQKETLLFLACQVQTWSYYGHLMIREEGQKNPIDFIHPQPVLLRQCGMANL